MIDFKRNYDVLKDGKSVLEKMSDCIDAEDKRKLERVFEIAKQLCTDKWGEYSDGEHMGMLMEDFVNNYCYDEKGFVNYMAKRCHRTLQYSFFSTILKYIKENAEMDDRFFDARNKLVQDISKEIVNEAGIFDYVKKAE